MGNAIEAQPRARQQAPPGRAFHESVALKDRMLVWGGQHKDFGYHSRLDLFSVNMLTGEWHQHTVTQPDTPPPCEQACSAAIDNTVFSFGGLLSSELASNELYKLNLDEMRWRKVVGSGLKPEGRYGAGMCKVVGKLLLMGGYGPLPSDTKHPQAQYKMRKGHKGYGRNNELFEFDPHTNCWSPVAVTGCQPSPRSGHTLTAIDEKRAVLFGGDDGNKLNDLWLFDYEKKIWSHISPFSLFPQPRSSHTVCTMVCDSKEIKVLLMGGYGSDGVLDDCWLLDVNRGVAEKVLLNGKAFKRVGHSAHCVTQLDGTVAVSVFGGYKSYYLSSALNNLSFYQWDPHNHSVLHSCLVQTGAATLYPFGQTAPTRAASRADTPVPSKSLSLRSVKGQVFPPLREASDSLASQKLHRSLSDQPISRRAIESSVARSVAEDDMRQLVVVSDRLTRKNRKANEDKQSIHQLKAELTNERKRADNVEEEKQTANRARFLAKDNVRQMTGMPKRLDDDKQALEQQVSKLIEEATLKDTQLYYKQRDIDTLRRESEEHQRAIEQMKAEKESMKQRLRETQQLLSNAEAASEAAEKRLAESKQVLSIPLRDIQLSDIQLGSGSFGGVRVGYWRGCLVAVKTLHEELSKEHYQRRLFEKEVAVCSRLHHPNIAAICGVIQEEGAPFSLIIELLQASLADVIEAAHVSGKYLTLREQTDVSHDCLSGLTYLHELPLPVLHGDIRPTNILMTSVMRAKLGDLGAARFTDGSLSVGPMSPLYVAPERLADRTLPNSKEADVYSMGISLGELFTGNQMDREDRPRQLRVVRQRNLRLVCVCMACDNVRNRMMASEVLAVNDRVFKTEDYDRCPPRRMVRGLADGVDKFTLCEKPW